MFSFKLGSVILYTTFLAPTKIDVSSLPSSLKKFPCISSFLNLRINPEMEIV